MNLYTDVYVCISRLASRVFVLKSRRFSLRTTAEEINLPLYTSTLRFLCNSALYEFSQTSFRIRRIVRVSVRVDLLELDNLANETEK
jgi:hypothetical protein